jgi:glucose dehydrogenase
MEEGKIFVYAKKDGKNLIAFKTNPYNTLNIIRDELIKKIKFSNFLFQKEDSFLIEKENEDQYLLCEILYNKNNFEIKACKNKNSGSNYDLNIILITVYLTNNVFYKGKISKY